MRYIRSDKKINLQDAITIACVAEILKAKVPLAFRELIAQSFLEFRARSTHQKRVVK